MVINLFIQDTASYLPPKKMCKLLSIGYLSDFISQKKEQPFFAPEG